MTTTTATTAPETTDRRRSPWRPLAVAAIGGSALVVAGFGAWASLSATAFNTTPQQVSTGTLKLALSADGNGFDQAISNVAPGDSIRRFVTLTNNGTLDAQGLTFGVTGTGSSVLLADGASTKALRVSIDSCTVVWNPTAGTCSGTSAQVLAPTAVSGLGAPVSLSSAATSAGGAYQLRVSVSLPDQNETTVNGALPTTTIQNATANLTYTFTEAQRAATVTNS